MPLSSVLNVNYRPSSVNVTQKYTPLNHVQVAGGDTAAVQAMLQNRINTFNNMGVRVGRLTYLCALSIDEIAQDELHNNPPLIVVSSNRSVWIKARYENAQGILDGIHPAVTYFNDVMDTRALAAGAVPIYLPIRLGAAVAATRNVYVFVAADEYTQYRNELRGTGITVVGWRTDGEERLSGFGASRYAALEFFKYINRQHHVCAGAWMFDDNVAYIRSFPGFANVENELNASYGLGFRGGTQAHADGTFTAMSAAVQPGPVAANTHINAPILQQTVLWNVAQFNVLGATFSPYYMTSAEDTSLTKFLNNLAAANCQFYNACEIFKGLAPPDNSAGVGLVQNSKNELLNYCYRQRNAVPFTSGVVPAAVDLAGVITAARNDPASPPRINHVAAEETGDQTYSKAVEQVSAVALDAGVALPAGVFALGNPQITSKVTRR